MPRYWFRQRTFGYGSTPNTWQGWLFTLVFLGCVLGVAFGWDHVFVTPKWVKGVVLIALAVPFVWITLIKTEGGWRWRS